MLSKAAARNFFLLGTFVCFGLFIGLSVDTFQRIPNQTNEQNITPAVARGKKLWEKNNCMGCHTIFGEGAYYAPELTKVYTRRGAEFIKMMVNNSQKIYVDQRKMVTYNFSPEELNDIVEFFKWIDAVDLNGFPPKPDLAQK